jgi:myo-inositol-1(or 4)-monophosphatase
MHPNVNFSIKLLRELGKKVARYFDDLSAHHSSSIEIQPAPQKFIESIAEKLFDELSRVYQDHDIIDLDQIKTADLQKLVDHDVWGYQIICGYENFLNTIPLFCMTLTYFRQAQAQHTVVYNPLTDEVYNASKGMGAQLNGRRLRIQKKNNVKMAYTNTLNLHQVLKLEECSVRLLGSLNLELAYLAANRADITLHHLEDSLSIAPGRLIAREAGVVCFVQEGLDKNTQFILNGPIDHLKKIMNFPLVAE